MTLRSIRPSRRSSNVFDRYGLTPSSEYRGRSPYYGGVVSSIACCRTPSTLLSDPSLTWSTFQRPDSRIARLRLYRPSQQSRRGSTTAHPSLSDVRSCPSPKRETRRGRRRRMSTGTVWVSGLGTRKLPRQSLRGCRNVESVVMWSRECYCAERLRADDAPRLAVVVAPPRHQCRSEHRDHREDHPEAGLVLPGRRVGGAARFVGRRRRRLGR